jgi:SAM-dependent methyltransferase
MRTDSLRWVACPVPGCFGSLSPSGPFEPEMSAGEPSELLEAVLTCGRCSAEYPVILGVAILETDLQSYLGAFWSEIEQCGSELDGADVSRRMRSYLGIPSAFTSHEGPSHTEVRSLEWKTSPYLQAHFDPESLTDDLPDGWWWHAVDGHRSGARDPYSYLLGAVRQRSQGRRVVGLAVDVGTSAGRGSAELAQFYEYSIGVDRSFPAILAARRLLLGQPDPLRRYLVEREKGRWEPKDITSPPRVDNLDYVVASGVELPIGSAAASCVAALNVLCAVTEPQAMIAEFSRVLSPGAMLVLSSPYWADSDDAAESPFAHGGPEFLGKALRDRFEIVAEEDVVPWLLRVARRRWNVYLCHCVVATRV